MKFWQRFSLLGSSFFLMGTLYYYTVLDSDALSARHDERRRALESRFGTSSFQNVYKSFSSKLDPAVCKMRPPRSRNDKHPYSNLTTLDIYHNAHFNVHADGMYELPTPPPDFPKKENMEDLPLLNVIIMPHSHVDPGWHRTTNEYYIDQTKHILTNMVNKLTEHPDLTFVWAETIYFAMWWNELEDAVKVHVRRLVRRGQLEIALGGWVMPDEASTHYVSVIDQLVEGHQWLWENLRTAPKTSWSIDPFGHSGTMPYLWKLSGMDNMVIQRVHQAVKASLMSEHRLEFWWRQFWDEKGSTDILCHIMPYMLYSIKFSCGPNRFICLLFDFRSIPGEMSESRAVAINDQNIEKFSEYLYKQFRQKSYHYKYNTILVPIGDDFRFGKELEWDQQYGNFTKLMRYMNDRKDWKINVKFGTLKDYFKLTMQEELSKKYSGKDAADFPILSGDFFPYSDRNHDYWTGYFTTRPFDKRFQREVQGHIQAADLAVTLTYAFYRRWELDTQEKFFHHSSIMHTAHRAQGQFLHHDAITGTSKDFVVVDYENQLLEAYNGSQNVMRMALQALVTQGKVETPYVFYPETVRKQYDQGPAKVVLKLAEYGLRVFVFNPLPQYLQVPVRLLVEDAHFVVKNHLREVIPYQINPVWDVEEETSVVPGVFEIVFVAELAPLATVPYVLFHQKSHPVTCHPARLSVFNTAKLAVPPDTHFQLDRPEEDRKELLMMQNEKLQIFVDPQSGRLLSVLDKQTGNKTNIDLQFAVYRSQASGAYLFRPKSGAPTPLISNIPVIRVVDGPVLTELTVLYEPYVVQTFTLYHHPSVLAAGVHIRNTLNIHTLDDHEVIMRMKTDLHLKHADFYSDQNGYQFVRRRTNLNVQLEANYYPLTSGAMLDDGVRRVSLLTAQPHGVASLEPGWLEVMLDRDLLYDDDRGLGEGVHDTKPTISEFVLLVETHTQTSQGQLANGKSIPHYIYPSLLSLSLSDRLQQPPQVFYSPIESDVFFNSLLPMKTAFPCDLALLSLRSLSTGNLQYNGTSFIVHRRAYDCDFPAQDLQCSVGTQPLTFMDLFSQFGMGPQKIRETSLTHVHHKRSLTAGSSIDVQPMQIASYHLVF